MEKMSELSLLWPDGQPTATWDVSPETIRDLELEAIVQAMCSHRSYRDAVRDVLFRLCREKETIGYRQIVLSDLQAQPTLAERLKSLLPLLDELTQFTYRQIGKGNPLQEVVARARELELLVEIVQQLHEAFSAVSTPLQSTGLLALRERIASLVSDRQFQEMVKDLPALLEALRSHASVTIGVNLDHHLRPEAAVLLAVNEKRFTNSSLLDRLLGKDMGEGSGIAPLHRPPVLGGESSRTTSGQRKRLDPLMLPLFKDLSKVLQKVSEPVAQELKKYVQINGRFLADLRTEIIFYVQALGLIKELQAAGMTLTYPEIGQAEERVCQVKAAYNLQLAIQKRSARSARPASAHIVTNDIAFGEDGRIAILTGPNQGGKTTYMQSIGLVQVLAQAGLPVPGEAARMSPVDTIYTHYPVEEQLELGTGRFGDEAQRIRAIFEKVTRYSLVLLNESLSTTSMGEGIYLARDIVRALRQIGLRAVFTTHMHELAAAAGEINAETVGDSAVFSLVASKPDAAMRPDEVYSYQIQPGPPLGRSYAEHIAARYGISDEQLQALLEERDLFSDGRR
jgi:DNA mismatch repair ATPase MutS